jgi:hypothetical protein
MRVGEGHSQTDYALIPACVGSPSLAATLVRLTALRTFIFHHGCSSHP